MRHSRILVLVLCVGLAVAATGCYGSFSLLGKVYDFNGDVSENKWMQEVTFLVLTILPVYGFASFADAILFNSYEFWTGSSLLGGEMAEEMGEGGGG